MTYSLFFFELSTFRVYFSPHQRNSKKTPKETNREIKITETKRYFHLFRTRELKNPVFLM